MNLQLDLENYPIWYIPFWQTITFKIIIILSLVSLVFLVCFLIYKIHKNRKKTIWELALLKIAKIENDQNEPRLTYFQLTEILKNYFSYRFNFDFTANTDDELIKNVNNVEILKLFQKDIEKIFVTAKLVKFSQNNLSDFSSDLKLSKEIIKATIPTVKEK